MKTRRCAIAEKAPCVTVRFRVRIRDRVRVCVWIRPGLESRLWSDSDLDLDLYLDPDLNAPRRTSLGLSTDSPAEKTRESRDAVPCPTKRADADHTHCRFKPCSRIHVSSHSTRNRDRTDVMTTLKSLQVVAKHRRRHSE